MPPLLKPNNSAPINWGAITVAPPKPAPAPVRAPAPAPAPVRTPAPTYAAPAPVPAPVPTPDESLKSGKLGSDSFMEALKQKLIGQSGAISSEDTSIEKKIQDAIRATNDSNEASAAAITSAYDREIGYTQETGQRNVSQFSEGRSGFATSMAALREVIGTTDKHVKDLEQRKQELILQGNATAASQVSGLIMKELEFEQQARIQTFSNMLNIGNFALKALETQFNTSQVAQLKSSDIETFTDAGGMVTAKNKITGETMWTARVGRSGSASPNLQVQPIANPTTGHVQYTQIIDKDSGEVKYVDNTGNEVDPSQVQIDKPADPLDTIINDVLNDIASDLMAQ